MALTLPKLPSGVLNDVALAADARQATVTGAGTPVPIIYGRQRIGAAIVAVGLIGSDLVLACAWAIGDIEAVESYTVNGQPAAATVVATHYLGLTSQGVDATLAAAITGYADTLVASIAGQLVGVAYTVLRIPAAATSGFPRVEGVIKGRKIHDPRNALTLYSTNPALALRDFMASTVYGQGLTVDAASVTATANACDEAMGDASKRREIGIAIDNIAPCAQWADVLRAYAGCFLARDGNAVKLVPDRPASSAASLTNADLVARSLKLSKRSPRSVPTTVKVRYTDTGTTPWRTAEAVAYAAGVQAGTTPRREEIVEMPGITRYAQAYREAVERLNALSVADLDAEWVCFDVGLKYQEGDVVDLTHAIGLSAKLFRILKIERAEPGRWRVSASEYSASAYSDSVTAGGGADSPLPSPATIAAPTALAAASGSVHLLKMADKTIISRMLVSATPPSNIYFQALEVEYQKTGDTKFTRAADGYDSTYCSPVEDNATYLVRARARNSFGVVSDWVSINHVIVGKTELPPPPQQFLISRDADGTRRFTWLPPAAEPLDMEGYLLRYKLGTGQLWANMTPLHQGVQKVSPYETNQLAAGTYTFAAASVDTTGNVSAAVYIEAVLGDPRLAGALEIQQSHLDGWPGVKTNGWVDPQSGWLLATDTKTWGNFPTDGVTWQNWTQYARAPATLVYTASIIDVGLAVKFTPLLSAEYAGTATLEVRTSNDNVTWSAWAAPAGQVTARYIQARATVAPVSNGFTALKIMTLILDASVVFEDINDLSTSSLTGVYRIGVGDVRLPITKTYGVIRKVDLALQNVGPGWSWEIIDKNTSPGPRIKIYNASNVLADATIDATTRGV